MSRYVYRPRGWPGHMEFAVGWDPALETYFAQAMDHSISRDDDCVILWAGGLPPHYRDLNEMMRIVNKRLPASLPPITLSQTMRAKLTGDFRIDLGGDAPHSTYPKCRAYPPFYLLTSTVQCPCCGTGAPVYALAASGLREPGPSAAREGFLVLTDIKHMPRYLAKLLSRPTWRHNHEDASASSYLLNHCVCGAVLSDDYLCGEHGAAFYPATEAERSKVKSTALPIEEEILIVCSWTTGLDPR